MWRSPAPSSPRLDVFMMEYEHDFLKTKYGSAGGVKRSEYLSALMGNEGQDRRGRLFADVEELEVELSAAEQKALIEAATDFGCTVERHEDRVILSTKDQKIVSRIGSSNRIVAVKMLLNRKQPAETIPIGTKTVLKFNGDQTATWHFN
jgi:hypothetical protein